MILNLATPGHQIFISSSSWKSHKEKLPLRPSQPSTVHLSTMFKGLLLSFISGLLFSLIAATVKHLKNINPGQLAAYRFFATFSFALPQAVKSQENIFGPRELRHLLILRCIFGSANIFLNYLAYQYLPLGEASVIICSIPVFVTIASRVFLKENFGIIQFITVIVTVVGIVFITKVPATLAGKSVTYTTQHIYGLIASVSSLFLNTCVFILSRKLKSVHQAVIMVNYGWIATLDTLILTAAIGNFNFHRCGLQQGLLVLIGTLSYAASTLLTIALQLEQAGPVSTMRAASDIIFAFVWQTFIFQNTPDNFSIVGAVLVGFSVVLLGLVKWVSSQPSESCAAKYLSFLMV